MHNTMKSALASALLALSALTAPPAGAQQAMVFGSWVVADEGELVMAVNVNSSNNSLAYVCERGGECLMMFIPENFRCDEGQNYAALMTNGKTSSAHSLTCRRGTGQKVTYAQVFKDFNYARRLMLEARQTVRIARAVTSDSFASTAFDMNGFDDAVNRVDRMRGGSSDRSRNSRSSGDTRF